MKRHIAALLLLATFAVAQDKPSTTPVLTDQQKLNLADALLNLVQAQQQLQSLPGYVQLSAKLGEAQKQFQAMEAAACPAVGKQKFVLDRTVDPRTNKTDWACKPAAAEAVKK